MSFRVLLLALLVFLVVVAVGISVDPGPLHPARYGAPTAQSRLR